MPQFCSQIVLNFLPTENHHAATAYIAFWILVCREAPTFSLVTIAYRNEYRVERITSSTWLKRLYSCTESSPTQATFLIWNINVFAISFKMTNHYRLYVFFGFPSLLITYFMQHLILICNFITMGITLQLTINSLNSYKI